jgi:hypothetical protein
VPNTQDGADAVQAGVPQVSEHETIPPNSRSMTREEWIAYLRSIGLARTEGEKVLKKFYSLTDRAWVQYEV